jgi:hypothetical protein
MVISIMETVVWAFVPSRTIISRKRDGRRTIIDLNFGGPCGVLAIGWDKMEDYMTLVACFFRNAH